MLEFRSFVGCLTGLVLGLTLAPSVALAANKDKAARQLQTEAMQTDYAETNFKKSEQKLKKAIKECGGSNCSNQVVGELHRDLATVYLAGMKQNGKAKTELKQALKADPDLQLNEDFATPALRKLFKELGGHEPKAEVEETPVEEKKKEKDENCDSDSGTCLEEEPAKTDSAPSKGSKNWLGLHFQQDLLLFSSQDQVCGAGSSPDAKNYSCFQNGAPFNDTIAAGPGNHVAGGIGRGTMRLMLGFDRLLTSNVSLGLRLGYAFGGRPPGTDKFSPLHLELRANYWFGSAPFEGSSVRPYLSLSGGLAEVDSKVSVEYYPDDGSSTKKTADAWRKTGKGFAGLGFGVMIPFAGDNAIVPELRAMQMFGASGTVFALSLGYARGF